MSYEYELCDNDLSVWGNILSLGDHFLDCLLSPKMKVGQRILI